MKYRLIFTAPALFMLFQSAAFAVTVRDVVFTTKNAGRVVFSHRDHINKKGMTHNCRVCHDAVFNLKKKTHYSMAEMRKGASCGACHEGKKAFGLDKCSACHIVKEVTFRVKETGPTYFSHKKHSNFAECGACHPKLYAPNQKNRRVGMAAMEKGASCGACHNAKQAFSVKECSKCHPVRDVLFEEKSTGNVIFSHTFHTGLSTCSDCHVSLYNTARSTVNISMEEMEQGKSCGGCHDGKTAFSVKEKCESCHNM